MSTSNGTTPLEPEHYWKLRALTAELERAHTALALAQTQLEAIRTRRQAHWTALVAQYALDATKNYAARDEDCTLLEATGP